MSDFWREFVECMLICALVFAYGYFAMPREKKEDRFALRALFSALVSVVLIAAGALAVFLPGEYSDTLVMEALISLVPHVVAHIFFLVCYEAKFAHVMFTLMLATALEDFSGALLEVMVPADAALPVWLDILLGCLLCCAVMYVFYRLAGRKIRDRLAETENSMFVWLLFLVLVCEELLFVVADISLAEETLALLAVNIFSLAVRAGMFAVCYAMAEYHHRWQESLLAAHAQRQGLAEYRLLERAKGVMDERWPEGATRPGEGDIRTGYEPLDIVLADRAFRCSEEGISLQCFCDASSLSFMPAEDAVTLFGGVLDDVLEHAGESGDGSGRYVCLYVRPRGMLVAVSACCSAASAGFGGESEADRREHEMRRRNALRVAERYGGMLCVSCESGIMTVSGVIPVPEGKLQAA